MFVRTATRRNKDGSAVRYVQLVQNEWDPATKSSRMKVVHSFGREDQLDRAAVERLAGSLGRLLGHEPAGAAPELCYAGSAAFGGTYLLDQLWQRLGIGQVMTAMLDRTRRDAATERVLFALVANRALDPSSKLAAAHWAGRSAYIDRLPTTTDDACYRAMDWLHQVRHALERQVFSQVAAALDLHVDLLFFDTTSTYFEVDGEDEPVPRDHNGSPVDAAGTAGGAAGSRDEGTAGGDGPRMAGFRVLGKSKDYRDDLPQIVIGMAVTRTGIPVRIWCWPGNTADSALIRQVKRDMRDWTLAKIVWVADRGFTSAENRRYLRRGDHHYIIGEKLRSGSAEATAALSRQGRYQEVAGNLRVKEVKISDHERFVICHNPEAAERDAATRARLLARLKEMTDGTDTLSATKRAELRGVISTKPGLNRYLRVTPGGLLRTDAAKIKAEENLDGKYLLRASDPHLSAADIAAGYKQLLEVERGWRTMKQVIDLRPVYHRLEQRIRAHVLLCWLALLLIRIAETTTGTTWNKITGELGQLTLGTFTGPAGTFRQTAELTKHQRDIFASLQIPCPDKIIQAAPTGPADPGQDHANA
jgi:hypothetical protein